jgi:hypothetical protein
MVALIAVAGILGVFSARGFVTGIRREPGERATAWEWLLGAGVGVLVGVMVASLLRGMF